MPHDRKKPLRWRRVAFKVFRTTEYRHELRRDTVTLAEVRKSSSGWYWSGKGAVSVERFATASEAKTAAREMVDEYEATSREQAKEGW